MSGCCGIDEWLTLKLKVTRRYPLWKLRHVRSGSHSESNGTSFDQKCSAGGVSGLVKLVTAPKLQLTVESRFRQQVELSTIVRGSRTEHRWRTTSSWSLGIVVYKPVIAVVSGSLLVDGVITAVIVERAVKTESSSAIEHLDSVR